MKTSKAIIKAANIYPRLRLFTKTPKGLKSTGIHKVKLILDKELKGSDFMTSKEVEKIRYLVEENGEKKIFERNKFNKSGDVDYLVVRLSEYDEGTEIFIEGTRKGIKNVVSISSVVGGEQVEIDDVENEEDHLEDINIDDVPE